jgi:enoyl-CoA hydratase/carnithine racemase
MSDDGVIIRMGSAGTAEITLDRAGAMNALSTAMGARLAAVCARAAAFSADRKEGIAAFVQKREPQWPGV